MAEKLRVELETMDRQIAELESQIPKAKDYDTMKKLEDDVKRLQFKKERLLPKLKEIEEKEKAVAIKEAKKRFCEIGDSALKIWNELEKHRVAVRRVLDELDNLRKENYALHDRFKISGPPVLLLVRDENLDKTRSFADFYRFTAEQLEDTRKKRLDAIKRDLERYKTAMR